MNTGKNTKGLNVEQAYRDLAATVLDRVARKVVAPHAVVEDACQFAWMQAWRYRASFTNDHPVVVTAWLVKVAQREVWNLLRANQAQPAREADVAETRDLAADERDELQAIDNRDLVMGMLDRVSPQQRRVLVLYSVGYSYDEICQLLGISYTAVNKALTKAKAKLRD